MRPIVYEIRRTMTSRFVIIMIVAIVGLSALLAYESGSTFHSSSVPVRTPNLASGYYTTGSNVTVVNYVYDVYGHPFTNVNVTLTTSDSTTYSQISGASGYVNFTLPLSKTGNSVSLSYSYKIFGARTHSSASSLTINDSIGYTGFTLSRGLFEQSNTSNIGFLLMYVGANGSGAPASDLYISPYNGTVTKPSSLIADEVYSANITGIRELAVFPALPANGLNNTYAAMVVPAGSSAAVRPYLLEPLGRLSTYSAISQSELQSLVFSGIAPIIGLLIPILAVFAGYLTYGKDRMTGVLESVLKRPVTRTGLIESRFVSNAASIIIAVVLSVAVGDLIIHHYFSMYLSTGFTLFLMWTYIVEGIAFLALVYMFSHITRSLGGLLGAAIGIFVVLDIFWEIIPAAIIAALGVPTSSSTYVYSNIALDYVSPSGYESLVELLFTKHIGFLSSVSINPAAYGVTSAVLVIAGIIWMAVPFIISYYLAKNRD